MTSSFQPMEAWIHLHVDLGSGMRLLLRSVYTLFAHFAYGISHSNAEV